MDLEKELRRFLEETRHPNADIELNTKILSTLYGFNGDSWPTRTSVGTKFKKRRQLVAQIIELHILRHFRKRPDSFPIAKQVANILNERNAISSTDLISRLRAEKLLGGQCSPQGILNLLHDLDLCAQCKLYNANLKAADGVGFTNGKEAFFVHSNYLPKLAVLLKEIRRMPGDVGISNFQQIENAFHPLSRDDAQLLRELISQAEDSWTHLIGGDFWFLFEDRQHNVLINDLKKVHRVVASCYVSELKETLRNAMRARPMPASGYPPTEIIEAYLRSSKFLEVDSNRARFVETFPVDKLSHAEDATRQFLLSLKGRATDFATIRDHLTINLAQHGYDTGTFENAVRRSPLVYVDRTRGDGLHTFRAIREFQSAPQEELAEILEAPETERVELLKSRLGQGRFRRDLIKLRRHCYVTRIDDDRFLRASHILPWSDATNEQRLNPSNGLLLSPNFDHLFDKAYISFEDDGRLLVSKSLPADIREKFGISTKLVESFIGADLGPETKAFMALHRKRFHECSEVHGTASI